MRCFLFAARRMIQAIPILIGVSLVVFGLVHIVPGNPIDMLLPPEASPEVIAQMKQELGFDKPLYIQYFVWLLRALGGNLGVSIFSGQPVASEIVRGAVEHLLLAIPAATLGFTLGIVLGMLAAFNNADLARQAVLRDRDHRRQSAALLVRHHPGA